MVDRVGSKVQVFIAYCDTSLLALSRESSVSSGELTRIVNGNRKPSRGVRERIAKAMNITLSELDSDMQVFISAIKRNKGRPKWQK